MALETARRVQDSGHDVTFATGLDNTGTNSFWDELQQSSLDVHELRWMKRAPGYWDLLALVELWKLFRTNRPDCLHLHTSKAGTLGAIAGRAAGVPGIVYSSHGHLFHSNLNLQDVTLTGIQWHV
ncbi:MAG: glycosyltransferase, partial [bacterium]